MTYHAFVQTPADEFDAGHLAQVPYGDLESALEHVKHGEQSGCRWGAVIDDGKQIHYLFGVDHDLLTDAMERVEDY